MSASTVQQVFVAPASFAQKRLWLLSQIEPENPTFNICSAVELIGSLDANALGTALQRVVDRHEALRTCFKEENGEPVQVILSDLTVPLSLEDLSGVSKEDERQVLEQAARREFDQPFQLAKGPLLRARLLRLAPNRHVLLSTIHHIVCDGWSMSCLVHELVAHYQGESLEPLALQYADFAEWQQESLRGRRLEKLLDYWTRQLADVPALLQIPSDRSRPNVRTFDAAVHRFSLGHELLQDLQRLNRFTGSTLFMVLLAGFQDLLSRYSGEAVLCVGTPVANRNRKEIEPLIGMFVNTLVLRGDLTGDPTFREFLNQVRDTSLGAFEHQDLPFEKLVEALQPERNTAFTPLFQSMFVLQNAPTAELSIPELRLQPLDFEKQKTLFDLTLVLEETPDGIAGALEYSTELFDAQTAERMCRHYRNLLTAAVVDPDRRVSKLPLLDEAERSLLERWSGSATAYPRDATISELFEEQVAKAPDAVALEEGSVQLTYRELNARANQVTHTLLRHGVTPDSVVAVCLDRSSRLVEIAVGILKAGAAYLSIEPSWPEERIEQLVRDSGASLLIGQPGLSTRLPQLSDRIVECVDEWLVPETCSPSVRVHPENLAYVSYTSGSTGVPKGVSVSHRAVIRLAKSADYVKLDANEVVMLFAPLSFDASTLELWGALLNGARLVIAPHNPSPRELGACIREHNVTTCWLSAGMFHLMVEEQPEDLTSVRQLLAGGDVLSPPHVRRFLTLSPGSTLINGYGPTENTTFTCCFPMTASTTFGETVPIGRPIPNTTVHIVDRSLNLVPVGVPGELVTSGDGLARGYLGQASQTARSFVPDPFSDMPGGRLYRTGDRARWLPDGAVEFLGRIDNQVKIRGFRVEPGEVEAVLTSLPDVKEAAVAARGESTRKRLIAWVVREPGSAIDSESIIEALKQRLASFMIPSAVHFIGSLPLSRNGKVDRAALPEIEEAPIRSSIFFTETEQKLAAIWMELLDVAGVHRESNFFSMGGHSLLAAQLVSRVRKAFDVELPLRSIFEQPVLAEQAAAIESTSIRALAVTLRHISRDYPVPLSRAQQRMWLLQQLDPDSTAYNIPVVLRLHGQLDYAALTASIEQILQRHEILRTAFAIERDRPMQVIHNELRLDLRIDDLRHMTDREREREVASRMRANAEHVFDLKTLPLFRIELLRLGEEEHMLLSSMHHIIFDGWSAGVLLRELSTFYASFTQHDSHHPAPLSIQYADYAAWQTRQIEGGELEQQRHYWQNQLATAPRSIDLPTDAPRSTQLTFDGAAYPFTVGLETFSRLKTVSERCSATMFMTTLAAFGLLITRYARQDRVVIASASANRDLEEIEPLIGCFVNTLPLQIDISGDPSFEELLHRVKRTALDAYANQDMPFEEILELLGGVRSSGPAPFSQIGFALQSFSTPSAELRGLKIELIESQIKTAKAELTLMLSEPVDGLAGSIEYRTGLFEHSTIAALAGEYGKLLEELAKNPTQSCVEILSESGIAAMPLASDLVSRSNLTRSQMLSWLGQQLRPGNSLYNIAMDYHIPAEIDAALLEKSIRTLMRSSDALRTTFRESDGVPMQFVMDHVDFALDTFDFSSFSDPEGEFRKWTLERISRPYDLDRICFNSALVKLGEQKYVWHLGLHHIIADGLAMSQIFRHVSELYTTARRGELPDHIEIPAYQEYIAWERATRSSSQYRAAEAYWQKQTEQPAELIPFYGRLAGHTTTQTESRFCELGEERSNRLRKLVSAQPGSAERRALFEVFGAILNALIYRISGVEEVSLGLAYHNRRTPSAKKTIGHFMTVVPVRTALNPQADSISSLAAKFGARSAEAFQHADFTVSNPPNRRTYEVFYNYQLNTFPEFDGLPVKTTRSITNREEDTLALHITDYGESGNLGVQMDFNTTDFTPAQMQQTIDTFVCLIDRFLEDRTCAIDRIDLLTEDDRTKALSLHQSISYPTDLTIHEIFERQVMTHPDDVALVSGNEQMTYAELNQAADGVAARLLAQGVGPDIFTGILLPRGLLQLTALLGVLKAGGAYVPIDADLPAERIHYILEDSGAKVLVTTSDLARSLNASGAVVICMDESSSTASHELKLRAREDNAAYAIYTSGSTGRPKGVAISHRSLVGAFFAWKDAYGLDTIARRHLQMANFSFDVFTGDWVRALCSGGALVLCPREDLLEPARLHALIERQKIDCAEFVPAVARSLMTHLAESSGSLRTLKACIVGSDTWFVHEYQQLRALCSRETRVINSYGLTEATIDSSFFESKEHGGLSTDLPVPIGKPYPNTRLYILDRSLKPVPPGFPGELFISGFSLARGYLGRPAFTAERFVPDPFNTESGARMYRTGDRARLVSNGDVEFLGRADHQVKIRGFRIELGEIEAALLTHPEVSKAAVVVHTGRLVAYVESGADSTVLRTHAAQSLPEYMVPSAFVNLPQLPHTASGKVDRRALPPPTNDLFEESYVAPRDSDEESLATIWTEVLGIPKIGVHDNFFELGGHSLLAAQVMNRTSARFGITLPLRNLFEEPTIAALAARIRAIRLAVNAVRDPIPVADAARMEGEL